MSNSLISLMNRSVLSLTRLLLLSCCLCGFLFPHPSCAEEPDKIQYISEQNNSLHGQLVPDPSPGTVPVADNPLIGFLVDGRSRQFSLSSAADGSASFSATISGLTEGRHAALLKSDNLDGTIKDSAQLLFIYDITPPTLELVFPGATEIAEHMLSFLVEFSDEGSGIASQLVDIDVTVTINGIPAAIDAVEQNDKRFLLIDYDGRTRGAGAVEYRLFVSLKDRAGNEATLEQNFTTEEPYEEKTTEEQTCTTPGNAEFTFDTTTRMDLSFPLTSRLSPLLFSREKMADIVEISIKTDEELDPGILDAVTITADNPHLDLKRLPASGGQVVRYEVRQQDVVSSLDGLSYLTVDYPRLLSVEYEWECSADGRRMEPSLGDVTVSAEHDSFRVPVGLYWRNSRSSETASVQDPDGSFFLEYRTWTEPNSRLLNTAASYLSFQNSAYFFDQQEGTFISRAPVEKEGVYAFQVTLASNSGTWAATGRPVGQEEHEMLFDLGGPVIERFEYNRESGHLEADFSDLGTPLEDLHITLGIDGFGRRDFEIEQNEDGTGRLISPFTLPPSVTTAHLSITDRAQNTVEKSCQIFGIPPEKPADDTFSVSDYSLKEKEPDRDDDSSRGRDTVLSSLSGGLSVVRTCPVEKIIAVSDYVITDKVNLTSRKTTKYYPYRSYRASGGRGGNLLHYTTTELQTVMIEVFNPASGEKELVSASSIAGKDKRYEVYSFEYCRNVIEDVLAPEIRSIVFNPADNSLSATISDHGRPASLVNTGLSVGVGVPPDYGLPVAVEHDYTAEQEPLISVSPSLSAPGMPGYSVKQRIISSLEVSALDDDFRNSSSARSRSSNGLTSSSLAEFLSAADAFIAHTEKEADSAPPAFTDGHGLSGTMSAIIPVPPLVIGEQYDLTLSARDPAGNVSSETLMLTIPRSPPTVTLELLNTDGVSSLAGNGGGRSATHLRAAAVDESGLDLARTHLDLDAVRLAPLSSLGSGGLGNPPRNPYAQSFNDILTGDSRKHRFNEYVAHYSALLEEGGHSARFTATDILGLSAEQQLDFTIAYLPRITNFAAKPKVIQDIGGPAFTAMIFDYGADLEPDGISFFIDGTEVEKSRLYYDPASGYFAVSGPFIYENGYHSAQIVARDNNDHQVSETLRFTVAGGISGIDGSADLRLETITIWELEQTNNDGQANPGELVRLFPALFNSGPVPLENCTAELSAEDSRIVVQTNEIRAGPLEASVPTTLLRGFDVQIGDDILDATISDPYETHFRLDVSCDDDSWELDFSLPVYRPSLPVDIDSQVSIELAPAARTTSEADITLRGTVVSSSSFVDSLTMRVNGIFVDDIYLDRATGAFEALVPLEPGSNIIDIEASDRSGATGYRTIFVNCRSSLSVTIDSLPSSTAEALLEVSGSVESSASLVDRVVLTLNGLEQPLTWQARQNRFEARITLEPGRNTIAVEAWDEAGGQGRAVEYVWFESVVSIVPPSITITSPGPGTSTNCGPVILNGNFDPGSSSVDQITATTAPASFGCQPVIISGSTFSVECGVDAFPGDGFYSVELRTSDGDTATDTVLVEMLGCN